MSKRNLNLGTDFILDSDEPFSSEFDFLSSEEFNEFFDNLFKEFNLWLNQLL